MQGMMKGGGNGDCVRRNNDGVRRNCNGVRRNNDGERNYNCVRSEEGMWRAGGLEIWEGRTTKDVIPSLHSGQALRARSDRRTC